MGDTPQVVLSSTQVRADPGDEPYKSEVVSNTGSGILWLTSEDHTYMPVCDRTCAVE